MYNLIYSIFIFFYDIFTTLDLYIFSLSSENIYKIETNLFDYTGNKVFIDVGNTLPFNLALLCTLITLILIFYMLYRICKLIICRIANV